MKQILRRKAVTEVTGLSSSTLWRLERAGRFPARKKLSANAVGYLAEDVEAWIQSRSSIGESE